MKGGRLTRDNVKYRRRSAGAHHFVEWWYAIGRTSSGGRCRASCCRAFLSVNGSGSTLAAIGSRTSARGHIPGTLSISKAVGSIPTVANYMK